MAPQIGRMNQCCVTQRLSQSAIRNTYRWRYTGKYAFLSIY